MRALIIDKKKNSVEIDISPALWKQLNVDISKAKKNTQSELMQNIKEFLRSDDNENPN